MLDKKIDKFIVETDELIDVDTRLDLVSKGFDVSNSIKSQSVNFATKFDKFYAKHSETSNVSTRHMAALTAVVLQKYINLHPEIKLTQKDIELLCKAAVLHDIGKIAVNVDILKKPERLLPEEAAILRKHTEYGYEIVSRSTKVAKSGGAQFFRDVCLMHHERYDGSGYPHGLKGDQIPIYVQLISAIDAYDALVSIRTYKPTYSHEMALEMLKSGECGAFSTDVIDCLFQASNDMRRITENVQADTASRQRWIIKETKKVAVSVVVSLCILIITFAAIGGFLYYLVDTLRLPPFWNLTMEQLRIGLIATLAAIGLLMVIILCVLVNRLIRLTRATTSVSNQFNNMRRFYELAESRYKAILEQTNHMVFEFDFANNIVITQESAQNHYGIKESYKLDLSTEELAKTIFADDIESYQEMWHQILGGKKRAECTVRLLNSSGHYVWNRYIMKNVYDDEMRAVRAIGFAEDVNDILQETKTMSGMNMRDTFTGSYNKSYTQTLIDKMCKGLNRDNPQRIDAFLILDLDKFKTVNDNFGHATGDIVIKNFAILLTSNCRGKDFVGRIGGDEFVYYIHDIGKKENALVAAKRILDTVGAIGGSKLRVTTSIGIGFAPDEGTDFKELYETADKNMYQAKRAGGNRYVCNAFED